ncbi:MAG: hypothetical protein FJ147_16285 [Deltaproteobacteria bacterium]|nr:hypothetical protein [Deltaproteobacteria bacterium]
MVRRTIFLGLLCTVAWFSLQRLEAQNQVSPVPDGSQPPKEPPPFASPEVQQRVLDVYRRNQEKLFENPDVLGVLPSADTGELWIETDRPDLVPKEVEGIPVKVDIIQVLPPPPGVIVLKPGGIREPLKDATSCPSGFEEHRRYRWRFCQPTNDFQPFPLDIMRPPHPPIAGIPYEKAQDIIQRHFEFFRNLPGIRGFTLRKDGIAVESTQPELVPKEVEGLPVYLEPVQSIKESSHTATSPAIRPVVGAIATDDPAWPCDPVTHLPNSLGGTLGGIVLVDGKPWGPTAAHVLYSCSTTATCPPCDLPDNCPPNAVSSMSLCPHYQGPILAQP